MSRKRETPALLKPEEAIEALRELTLKGAEEGFITVADVNNILDRVATAEGRITYKGIAAGVLEAINRAGADGVPLMNVWTHLRRGGDNIPLATVESVVQELELAHKIHTERGGALTVLKIGAAPVEEGK